MSNFGSHLMIDCHNCTTKINDMRFVYEFLDGLVKMLNMTQVIPPYVIPYSGKIPEDKGITGVVIIAESHITVHTFTEKDYVFVDVFSCKPFDVEMAKKYIVGKLESRDNQTFCVERGARFPR